MSQIRQTPVKVGGKNGIIIHDKLCADGPKDPETGKPLLDSHGCELPGPNDDMASMMHDYLVALRSPVQINGTTVPRFGVLTLISQNTPIYVYDHPALMQVTNTAFTDGIHVFVAAPFMRKLVQQEMDCDGTKSGVLFLLNHELMHKLYRHVDRLKNIPPHIANIAEDLVINGKLVKGYPQLKPVPLLAETGVGMKPSEAEMYFSMSEEVVAETLLIKERKENEKKKKQKSQGQEQDQQGGGGSGGGQSQDGGDPSGQKQKGKGKGQQGGESGEPGDDQQGGGGDQENEKGQGEDDEYSNIHHITPEELLEIFEEEGLMEGVGKALNLPKRDDIEGIGKMKEKDLLHTTDAVMTAMQDAANMPGGNYPGAHIATEAYDTIRNLHKGKIKWRLAMRKACQGDGLKMRKTDDLADLPWYLDKGTMGVDPFYAGALVPHSPEDCVLVLIDTSGSTSGGTMRQQFMSEAVGLQSGNQNQGDMAKEVIVMSADSVVRGKPTFITRNNMQKVLDEGMPIFGNGGTDFSTVLKQAIEMPEMKKKDVKTIVYFTDCECWSPKKEEFQEFLDKGGKILFVCTKETYSEKFAKDVSPFAEVHVIEDGTEINLDKSNKEIEVNTRKNRIK
jgi:predicted metal-dependent peptidase